MKKDKFEEANNVDTSTNFKGRVAFCTHVFNSVPFEIYFNHMHCAAEWARTYDLVFMGRKGLSAATARNQLSEMAIENNCSHLLIVDGDHLIPKQLLDHLWDTRDEAMVSGVICKRGNSYEQVCYQRNEEGLYTQVDLPLDGRCYQVAVCAFGATLINLEKLQKLKKPFFRDTFESAAKNSEPYNFRSDVNLCKAFYEIGEKCFIDTRVLVGHYGCDNIVYPQNAQQYSKLMDLIKDTRSLTQDQKGVYYDPT